MNHTDFDNSVTTPYDVSVIFYKLSNSGIISDSSKEKLFNSLVDTDYENLIPAGIPNSVRIVHKYGADDGELNDAGIIYTTKPYILVIMSKNINVDEAQTEIPKISKIVYDWSVK